ncbi:MAG: ATP-binding cassette domain-containing protein [Nitrospirota bacterium]|nr:ATP-binding cassette domain-containing protein [Nitrospirota bacterium]
MAIVQLIDVSVGYGTLPVLNGIGLTIEPGERVALVGRNGEGKSTLMKLIAGELIPDDGALKLDKGATVARLAQEVPDGVSGTVFDVVAEGLGKAGRLIAEYHHLTVGMSTPEGCTDKALARLDTLGSELETVDGWNAHKRVEGVLTRMELDPEAEVSDLSGGMKRRVLLARALASAPSLLLLDEPTNHLDIEAIRWLEKFLSGYGATLLFVTHDREFLQRLATRVIELDRGHLTSWPGGYKHFLEGKASQLEAEEKANAHFDKKLAQEEVWIRKGIKARRTRNEGRVRALKKMREERLQRRERHGNVKMTLDAGQRSGRLVAEAEGVSFAYPGGEPVIRDLTTTIMRGDRVGIIGPNGVGKTTLIKLLLGQHQPTGGRIKLGTGLEVAWFDQLRATLDDNETVRDAVNGGAGDMVQVGGRERHVVSYLRDFLFSPERIRVKVGKLSGGERARLLLARLFTRPANLLVMDEPTNDLDAETLELLEDLLMEYPGTLLMVSHDRAFLDNVVTSVLVLEGDGQVIENIGGYADWLERKAREEQEAAEPLAVAAPAAPAAPVVAPPAPSAPKKKLSYKEQQELAALPARIDGLEKDLERLTADLADPAFYKNPAKLEKVTGQVKVVEAGLAEAYARWEALDG